MIIKIEDLPDMRNVKKISFDIEFEDGEIKTLDEHVEKQKTENFVNKSEARVYEPDSEQKDPTEEISEVSDKPVIPQVQPTRRPENVAFDMDQEF